MASAGNPPSWNWMGPVENPPAADDVGVVLVDADLCVPPDDEDVVVVDVDPEELLLSDVVGGGSIP